MRVLLRPALWAVLALALASPAAWAAAAPPEHEAGITDSGTIYNAVWAMVTFLGLLGLLYRWAWKPILQATSERGKNVARMLADAKSQQEESRQLREKYLQRLQAVDAEAAERLRQAELQAEQAKLQLLQQARQQASDIANRASEEIAQARQAATDELYGLGAELATAAAKSVLQRELNADDQRRLIAQSLEEIRRQNRKASAS